MEKYDVKKAHRELYAPPSTEFTVVDVPELRYIAVGGRAKALDLAAQRQVLDGAADGNGQCVDLHRLGDAVVRAGANCGDRGIETALAGQYDR